MYAIVTIKKRDQEYEKEQRWGVWECVEGRKEKGNEATVF